MFRVSDVERGNDEQSRSDRYAAAAVRHGHRHVEAGQGRDVCVRRHAEPA